jgi:hypothetical protein
MQLCSAQLGGHLDLEYYVGKMAAQALTLRGRGRSQTDIDPDRSTGFA